MRVLGLAFIFVIAFSGAAASAVDVSGNWSGKTKLSVDGKVEEDTVYLSLKQTANIVTGTAGPSLQTQSPISAGKVEGNRIILEVPVPGGTFTFDMNLEGEHLKGDVIASAQGQTIKAQMDAVRVK
jgi:hypothetical protein